MEQNFQTSFIPKKPMIEERPAHVPTVSFLSLISLFIFFSMLLVTGGLFLYKGVVAKSITKMESDLTLARGRFEPDLIIELGELDRRLVAANELLHKHIAISPIFEILEKITMKSVRYTNFEYGFDSENKVVIKMKGQAIGYRSVALQSDLFSENKNIIDPVFSNLALDDFGNVLFDLEFTVDPTLVGYEEMLEVEPPIEPEPID